MPQPKKFDAVTVIGVICSMALIWYGLDNMRQRAALDKKIAEEQRIRDEQAAAQKNPGNGAVVKKDGDPTPAPKDDEVENKPTPDITVAGEFLELTFSSKGATLVRAKLPKSDEDPAQKDGKGLVLLTEIRKGRHAFGIPHLYFESEKSKFQFSDPEVLAEQQTPINSTNYGSLDNKIWVANDRGLDAAQTRTIEYSLTTRNLTITKTFTFRPNDHFVRCEVKVKNETGQNGEVGYRLNGPQGIMPDVPPIDPKAGAQQSAIQAEMAARESGASGYSDATPDVTQIYASDIGGMAEEKRKVSAPETLWAAVKNRFHMATFVSLEPRQLSKILASKIQNSEAEDKRLAEPNIAIVGNRAKFNIADKGAQADPYAIYLGPADDHHIEQAEADLKPPAPYHMTESIQFCEMFFRRWPNVDRLARAFMWMFQSLHKFFGSFGIALVVTTILIKLALHPLQRKTMVSMSKVQALQPDMDKIKKKYADQKSWEAQQKMSAEMRDLMSKNGASMGGGCLPMLIQLPVLSALYGIFSHAYDMRGASFLWIKDLSQPDHLSTLPFWPHWLNALPVLYVILVFVQQRLNMANVKKSDDPQQEMQRKMMMFMPLMISVMWYSMPAGLMMYFVISALWSWGESWYIKKFLLHNPNAVVTGGMMAPGI